MTFTVKVYHRNRQEHCIKLLHFPIYLSKISTMVNLFDRMGGNIMSVAPHHRKIFDYASIFICNIKKPDVGRAFSFCVLFTIVDDSNRRIALCGFISFLRLSVVSRLSRFGRSRRTGGWRYAWASPHSSRRISVSARCLSCPRQRRAW